MCTVSSFHLQKTGFSRSKIIGKVRVSVWGIGLDGWKCMCVYVVFLAYFQRILNLLITHSFHHCRRIHSTHSLSFSVTRLQYFVTPVSTAMVRSKFTQQCHICACWTYVSVNNVSFRCGNVISNACNTTNISQLDSHIHCSAIHSKMTMMAFRMRVCVCVFASVWDLLCLFSEIQRLHLLHYNKVHRHDIYNIVWTRLLCQMVKHEWKR